MTKGQRHGIRGVVRFGRSRKPADPLDHFHYLLFLRTAITHNRLLDLQRRVFINLHPCPLAGQQDHSPAVSYGNAGRKIGIEKQFFHRHGVGPELLNEKRQVVIDLTEA